MSKVEAAASLFGSSDSGSDFFTAQEGGESRTDSPANGTDSNGAVINQDSSNLFENTADAGDATILFPGSDAQEDLFGESGHAKADIGAVAASAHGYEDYNAVNGSSSGNGLGNEASIETQYDYSQHGWDTQSGQWNGYGQYEPVQGAGELWNLVLFSFRSQSLQALQATTLKLQDRRAPMMLGLPLATRTNQISKVTILPAIWGL